MYLDFHWSDCVFPLGENAAASAFCATFSEVEIKGVVKEKIKACKE
jgi:hypothetical protein